MSHHTVKAGGAHFCSTLSGPGMWVRITTNGARQPVGFFVRTAPGRALFIPVASFALGGLRSEINVYGAVGVGFDGAGIATWGRVALVGLQYRTGLGIVGDHRPERLYRDVRRQVQPVVLCAVEIVAVGIDGDCGILRSASDVFYGHRRGDSGRKIEKAGARIDQANAVVDV